MRRHAKGTSAGSKLDKWTAWRSVVRPLALALGLSALLVLAFAGSALAGTTVSRPLLFSIDGSETPQGEFKGNLRFGAAVDESSGKIYVNNEEGGGVGAGLVDVFSSVGSFLYQIDGVGTPGGKFIEPYGIAVDNSDGPGSSNVFVARYAPQGVTVFNSSGLFLYEIDGSGTLGFEALYGLTVTDDSHLLIQQGPGGYPDRIFNYTIGANSATFSSQISDESLRAAPGIAADSAGNFYIAQSEENAIEKRDATTGAVLQSFAASSPENPAFNRGSEKLFVTEGPAVAEYSSEGALLRRFGGILGQGSGLAVDESTDRVVVVDQAKRRVYVYGPPESLTVPDVAIGSIAPDYFTADVSGTINPQGVPSGYRFEYRVHGTKAWKSTALLDAGEGSADVAIEATLPNLIQNTEYELRMAGVATDSGAIATSPIQTFKTKAVPPPSISAPTEVESESATFHGAVDPHGVKTGWHFEYSANGTDWTKAPAVDENPGSGEGDVAVSTTATGLDPNTNYKVRLVVTYLGGEGGSVTSSQISFTTDAEKPVIAMPSPADVIDTSATIQAAIDPRHAPTTYFFRFGEDETYGTTLPATEDGDAGSQLGLGRVAAELHDLKPNTTYHFQVVATNVAGQTETEDISFATRTTAEVTWPARGYEMINTPDKGNQAVYPPSKLEPWTSVSPDGNRVLWMTANGGPDSSTGAVSTYLAQYTPSGWTSRTTLPPASELPGEGNSWFTAPVSFTPDFSRSILLSFRGILGVRARQTLLEVDDQRNATPLTVFPSGGIDAGTLLETSSKVASGGRVVLGGGSADSTGPTLYEADGSANSIPVPNCGYSQIDAKAGGGSWVNSDASRIFVYSAGDGDCGAPRGIFMLEPASGNTTLVSGAQSAPANFIRADSAGTRLLYAKGGDAYRWSKAAGEECLTCGSGYAIAGGIASPDLSHLYFCGPIAAGSPKGVDCAIYVWRASGIDFVANKSEVLGIGYAGEQTPMRTDERGDQLIFVSTRPFVATADATGWNGNTATSSVIVGAQLYRYDDNSGIVECVSCTDPAAGALPAPESLLATNRPTISADGQTIAFATSAKLVPQDINGRYDVYEWHNGLTRLVTDGESEFESSLSGTPRVWGLSPDGRSLVFSAGGAAITGNEVDTVGNVYDARVGSAGFPPQPPPAHCSEDSCQGPLTPPPALAGAASATFSGPGNESQTKKHKKHKKHKKKHHKHSARPNHKRGGVK